jgi:hypothetical protein
MWAWSKNCARYARNHNILSPQAIISSYAHGFDTQMHLGGFDPIIHLDQWVCALGWLGLYGHFSLTTMFRSGCLIMPVLDTQLLLVNETHTHIILVIGHALAFNNRDFID